MVLLDSPNQTMPAGTQATDGSDCRPDRIGPIAARTGRTRATRSPSGVPIATLAAKPTMARDTLSQIARSRAPDCHCSTRDDHTSDGAGNVYVGRRFSQMML